MNQIQSHTLLATAKQLDDSCPLSQSLDSFDLPSGKIYLDGNSLGPLPKQAKQRAREVVDIQWGQDLIESWNKNDWINLPFSIGNKIAKLIGASENSVVCCDSISINLFKVLAAALNMSGGKRTILSQSNNFPTDLYMVQGLQNLLDSQAATNTCKLLSVHSDQIEKTMVEKSHEIGVLLLTHVNYKTGEIFNMEKITELAHKYNILVIWDLAHSAGVLPLELDKSGADFAVGCTYKYLNGGPGAPAFVYVAEKHLSELQQPLTGWMGHAAPFNFDHNYEKADGIGHMLCGTPSIISMSILDASLDVFHQFSIDSIREKSIGLNRYFQNTVNALLEEAGVPALELGCPVDAELRGSQISYVHTDAYAICQALISKGVIPDFRAPNVLRIGFSPLFLNYQALFEAAQILCGILDNKEYLEPQYQVKNQVT